MSMKGHLRNSAVTALAISAITATMGMAISLPAQAGGRSVGTVQATTSTSALPTTTNRIIVKYRGLNATVSRAPQVDFSQLRSLEDAAARSGMRISPLRSMAQGAQVMKLDRFARIADVEQIARQIRLNDPNVEYAEPDLILVAQATPNDSRYNEQWHYFEATGGINMPSAWDKATGQGVVVAVLDTGYRPHVDLNANIVSGYDMINDTAVSVDGDGRDADASDPGDYYASGECGVGVPGSDSSWHGTHVAGTIAAVTNNGTGVAGVAYNAKVQPIRVLGKCGGYTSDIADGIIWSSGGTVSGLPANATPAKVLNMSLGGSGSCGTTTQNAINGAISRGATVVVAAGNSNTNASNFNPANCTGVIAVAATNRSGGRAYYSNYGTIVSVAAPGGDVRNSASDGILSTLNAGTTTPGADNYDFYQGTSMASPHVAGVVALMLEKKPTLTPAEVKTCLQNTARAFPATCSGCGTGIVNASAVLDAVIANNCAGGGGGGGGGTIAETEPNNSRSAAQVVSAPGTVNGTMSSSSDNDYFRISLPAGKTLAATLTPNGSSDYDLYVYNSSGRLITSSTNGTGAVDTASVTNSGSSATTVYVRVRYYSGTTGSSGTYTLGLNW
jgi:serine protease